MKNLLLIAFLLASPFCFASDKVSDKAPDSEKSEPKKSKLKLQKIDEFETEDEEDCNWADEKSEKEDDCTW